MGVNSTGGSVSKVLSLSAGGTTALYGDAENIVYFQCSFGNAYVAGRATEVTLFRRVFDSYWGGTVISTYNQ